MTDSGLKAHYYMTFYFIANSQTRLMTDLRRAHGDGLMVEWRQYSLWRSQWQGLQYGSHNAINNWDWDDHVTNHTKHWQKITTAELFRHGFIIFFIVDFSIFRFLPYKYSKFYGDHDKLKYLSKCINNTFQCANNDTFCARQTVSCYHDNICDIRSLNWHVCWFCTNYRNAHSC